jgi:hypothetical protein
LSKRRAALPTAQPATDALSSDEPALMQAMAEIEKQYRSEDIGQQAFMECLEASGGEPFPLSELVARAKVVHERQRQRDRRAVKRHVPISDDEDQIDVEDHETVVLDDRTSPESRAVLRDGIRRLEADPEAQQAVRRALTEDLLTRTEQNKASRGKVKLRRLKRFIGGREKRRRAVLRRGRRSTWAVER